MKVLHEKAFNNCGHVIMEGEHQEIQFTWKNQNDIILVKCDVRLSDGERAYIDSLFPWTSVMYDMPKAKIRLDNMSWDGIDTMTFKVARIANNKRTVYSYVYNCTSHKSIMTCYENFKKDLGTIGFELIEFEVEV